MASKNVKSSKDPVELFYERRITVNRQKKQLIYVKLNDFSHNFIIIQCGILFVVALFLIGIQIGIMVHKTQLFYIATGFWMALVYFLCCFGLLILINSKSYGKLMATLSLHILAIIVSIGGIITNIFDMALFNVKCINACDIYSSQYLNLMIIIFSSIALISTLVFLAAIEYYILRESRHLNIFLENRR
ncbi:unnamed protein product [Brachionus calyciflorus]|uniref:MARVEL domain-containing protein n=1 Tax=Brachionus calyciflorus TaxID=104777 RepID=A0A813T641_9BILA|nr:unnamed protein product [Brachionus calyciflorus]